MYINNTNSEKSFLETYYKYNNKIKYLKETDLSEEQKQNQYFKIYKINSNEDLTQKEYEYDNSNINRYFNDKNITEIEKNFDTENEASRYVNINFGNCNEYAFLITKELGNNNIKTIIDVKENECLLSTKNIKFFRNKYIKTGNEYYYPIKSINLYETLKKALTLSKESGISKLELSLKYKFETVNRTYLFINSKFLKRENEQCIMIAVDYFNKGKFLDIFEYKFDSLKIENFSLFVKEFFRKIPYIDNIFEVDKNSVEISAKTQHINLQEVYDLLIFPL